MLSKALKKHAAEFRRYFANRQYEVTPNGILFAKAKAEARGVYRHAINGEALQTDYNRIPDAGMVYVLNVALNNGTKLPNWYLSLYAADYTPAANLTAANYPATASEFVSNTEGYSQTTRILWVPTTATTPTIDNTASQAVFTIATASSITIRGIALHSENTKGGTTGTLISATKINPARTGYNGDAFTVSYGVELVSS